jgi:predicted type IV restriction endonuclease
MSVPNKVAERIRSGLKQFQSILVQSKERDVSEADTVTIVKDMLGDLFGFDKYQEVTGEHAIRGTYCDLAIKVDGTIRRLIEVKAIGIALAEKHTRQAVNYAANQGVDWVLLTNGIEWYVYHIIFKKPIDIEEVLHINILEANTRNKQDLERLFLLTRECVAKDGLKDYKRRQDAISRYMVAGLILHNDSVTNVIKRELYRATEVRVSDEELESIIREEVLKRDALTGDRAEHAARVLSRASAKQLRKKTAKIVSKGDAERLDSAESLGT